MGSAFRHETYKQGLHLPGSLGSERSSKVLSDSESKTLHTSLGNNEVGSIKQKFYCLESQVQCPYCMEQGLTINRSQAKTCPLCVFVDKVLLEHNNTHCLHLPKAGFELPLQG